LPEALLRNLYDLRVLKKTESGEVQADTRLLADEETLQRLKHLPEQIRYFFENREMIAADEHRLHDASLVLGSFIQKARTEPEIVPHIVAVGWWKMLSMSEMPASIDDFLKAGFSPKDWATCSMRAIPRLSASISGRLGNSRTFDESVRLLEAEHLLDHLRYQSGIGDDAFERTRRVLQWNEIEQQIPLELVKFLGVSWFLIVLLEDKDLVPLEQTMAMQLISQVFESASILMNKPAHNFEVALEKFLTDMDSSEVYGASGLLLLPEVI
jgi:hypothetical protein